MCQAHLVLLNKYYIQTHFFLGQSLPVINEIFHFTYVLNSGAAFGILENQTDFFVAVAFLVVAASGYFFWRAAREHRLLRFGISLISAGAVGNLIDRVRTGLVVDFLDFRVWPVFNVADMAIVCGVGLVIFILLFCQQGASLKEERQ